MTPARVVKVYADTYLDSVLQLMGTRAMEAMPDVRWAAAAMATAANLDTLRERGFVDDSIGAWTPGDLFVAVEAVDEDVANAAVASAQEAMFAARRVREGEMRSAPRSVGEALRDHPESNIAIVSVPGEYAALEAHKALAGGLDVLLFSDNVSRSDEIELKDHARARDRLLMGPGAGTALLGGVGLAFANVVRPGRVGVIAAAGTGAQEAMVLLDRWGAGVTHVIGLGGRDLNEDIDGRMAKQAIEYLVADERTEVILFVSKPAAARVAHDVLSRAAGKPLVAAFMGADADMDTPGGVLVRDTLEGGVVSALDALRIPAPDTVARIGPTLDEVIGRLDPDRVAIRGLYSGGTLCYEALVLLGRYFGPVYSNTPVDKNLGLPAPDGSSVLLDLGEEEFTKGRPHPMIDPQSRVEILDDLADDPSVAVIVIDVVLGYGAHPDPAGVLAPVCSRVMAAGGPQVVAYVLGTDADPQGFGQQVDVLRDAGCIVTRTAARAALVAAAIAARRPDLAGVEL